jgi:hypothetical protein
MITCREVSEIFLDYTAGQPVPERGEGVNWHIRLCPSCAAYVESYYITLRMARQLPPMPISLQLRQRLQMILEGAKE